MSRRQMLRAIGLAVTLVGASTPTWGHGQVDQSYHPGGSFFSNCGVGGGSEFQSFKPAVSPLVAVGIYLSQPANVPTTVRIRSGSPVGTVLASATATFPASAPVLKHFDLPAPLAVTPGATYVIELVFPVSGSYWLITDPGGYAGGQAYGCTGNAVPSMDFHFETHIEITGCTPNATTLCLHGSRFRVTADWRIANGTTGAGHAVQLTNGAGYFWFFDAANVEVLVKMVDACSYNQRFWVFSSGLTDVFVDLDVLDTLPEAGKHYVNPLGHPFTPILDSNAFATCP